MTWGGKLETRPRAKPEVPENDEEECSRSEISSSLDGDGLVNTITAKKNVVDITCSILQLAQSIESKYLKKPLGTTYLFIKLIFSKYPNKSMFFFKNYFSQVKTKKTRSDV